MESLAAAKRSDHVFSLNAFLMSILEKSTCCCLIQLPLTNMLVDHVRAALRLRRPPADLCLLSSFVSLLITHTHLGPALLNQTLNASYILLKCSTVGFGLYAWHCLGYFTKIECQK